MRNRLLYEAAFAAMALAVVSAACAAENHPYQRYESVVERQMFGQPPEGFDPTKPPSAVSAKEERAKEKELSKEQEQLKSAIHFSMINVLPTGEKAVGFTDNSNPKEPKHYYLKLGESRDGWTVKEADPIAASMTVVKNDIEVSLSLGGNSASGGGTRRAGSAQQSGGAAPAMGRRSNLLGGGSLRERRMQRAQQQAEERRAAAAEKAAAEAKAAEEKAQREAEREQEKAEHEKEREEQRAQLLKIQEELKRAREEAAAKKAEESQGKSDGEGAAE